MTTQKVKTLLDDQKTKLTAKPLEKGARPPTFQLSTYFNNPQFVVYPNHDNGSGVSFIGAGMDVFTFNFILEVITHMATQAENGALIEIENKRDIPKEKRTDPKVTKQVVSKTLIGRDEEGRVYISVIDNVNPNAPKIRFYFQPNYYHPMRTKPALSDGQISQMFALGWVRAVNEIMSGILLNNPNAAADRAAIAEKFGNKGGNNNSSYGNKGGNNSYGNKSSYGNSNNSNSGAAAPASNDNGGFGGDFDDDWDDA